MVNSVFVILSIVTQDVTIRGHWVEGGGNFYYFLQLQYEPTKISTLKVFFFLTVFIKAMDIICKVQAFFIEESAGLRGQIWDSQSTPFLLRNGGEGNKRDGLGLVSCYTGRNLKGLEKE